MQLAPEPEDSARSGPAAPPCIACGAESECAIWGHRVCYPCATDWRDHSPTYGEIYEKHGREADAAAVYRAFTERWARARKGRAA